MWRSRARRVQAESAGWMEGSCARLDRGRPVDFWRPGPADRRGALAVKFLAREGPTSEWHNPEANGVRLAFAAPHLPAVMQCIYNGRCGVRLGRKQSAQDSRAPDQG